MQAEVRDNRITYLKYREWRNYAKFQKSVIEFKLVGEPIELNVLLAQTDHLCLECFSRLRSHQAYARTSRYPIAAAPNPFCQRENANVHQPC